MYFMISPPVFELQYLGTVLRYKDVTPHFGNLTGRITWKTGESHRLCLM